MQMRKVRFPLGSGIMIHITDAFGLLFNCQHTLDFISNNIEVKCGQPIYSTVNNEIGYDIQNLTLNFSACVIVWGFT